LSQDMSIDGESVASAVVVTHQTDVQPMALLGGDNEFFEDFDHSNSSDDDESDNSSAQIVPMEISGMKVHSKHMAKFMHREKHRNRKSTKFANKYMWHTKMKKEDASSQSVKNLRPLSESTGKMRRLSSERLASDTPSKRLSLMSPVKMRTKQSEALAGLSTLRKSSSMQVENTPKIARAFPSYTATSFDNYGHQQSSSSEDDEAVLAIDIIDVEDRSRVSSSVDFSSGDDDDDSIIEA